KKGVDYLETITKTDEKLKDFENKLEAVYDHFEATHRLPVVMVDSRGEYQFDGLTKKAMQEAPVKKQKWQPAQHRVRNVTQVADVVYSWPKFQGGGDNFLKFLEKMGKAIGAKLPQGMQKANVQIEFIVDVDGVPTNFKVLQGVNEEFDDEMISILEQMPVWEPATVDDKPVAKKIKQSFLVEK
ncbi:MAG TPA: energy transducer TonB, partial [Flavisolibacter sp.]|nr:energy transducer TonB [Flavisolibacter sp.]